MFSFTFNIFFSVVEGAEDNSSDEDAEEVREVTKLLSGGIMETQFGDLNVFANANRDTPTPPMTGMNILLAFLALFGPTWAISAFLRVSSHFGHFVFGCFW